MIVLTAIVLLTVAVGVVCFALIYHYLNMIQKVDDNDTSDVIPPSSEEFETDDLSSISETSPTVDPDDIVWPSEDELPTITQDSSIINIMIVGQDRREGEGRQRSDSMILASINTKTKTVTLISFLRDTWVQIPGGYSDNRLNYPYKAGGFKLMKETFYKNFGVTIDGCFECDFFDFIDIIDLLGGVEINITEKEAEYLSNLNVPSGLTTLNGTQALAYARIRKIDSDFQRTQRQRTILVTLFNKFKSASVSELNEIANQILPKLSTDMDNGEIMSLMAKLLPMVSSMEITQLSIPFSGAYEDATIRGAMVLVPDLVKIREKLASVLSEQ